MSMKYAQGLKCNHVFQHITLVYLFVLEYWHWDANLMEKVVANNEILQVPPVPLLNTQPFKAVRLPRSAVQSELIIWKGLYCK